MKLLWILCTLFPLLPAQLIEEDRLAEYEMRGYKWPLPAVLPNTEGWRRLQYRRLAQVERITSNEDRYNGWMSVMPQAISMKNFTENGWGLARAPPELLAELKESLHRGLESAPTERFIDVIDAEEVERPLFIRQPELNRKVLSELRPMHEAWSGLSLTGATAYGLRAYRNNTILNMHVDKVRTHIISSILHIDHSDDSEPWPLFIEDYQGNTNEVVLESGDMLFYESSKCIHGRPRKFNGSWYSSIFIHYFPVDWNQDQMELETHYAIPAHWHTAQPRSRELEELTMVGTSMREPECPDFWCGVKDTVKWNGPAKDGIVISTGYSDGKPLHAAGDEL